jgi:hypothetical protein
MGDWLYTARERFTPASANRWRGYLEWIGFGHIEELVTLDHMLCPELIDQPNDADWSHNVQADYQTTWFHDCDYLRQRCEWQIGRDQIIAMIAEPTTESKPPRGFDPCGFDILDGYDSISVLTNCGRFPGVIEPNAVNKWGLLPSLAFASSIAERIQTEFPEEPHCTDCRVWQLARDAELRK